MKKFWIASSLVASAFFCQTHAQDITGVWKNIDDKTGSSKAILEIRKSTNNTFVAKIIKVTPRPGYTPKEFCVNCPAPYTNKPILGMDILTGLTYTSNNNFSNGKIIDPLTGKIYNANAKLSTNGKRLTLRGFLGVSAIGRSQTWIKED